MLYQVSRTTVNKVVVPVYAGPGGKRYVLMPDGGRNALVSIEGAKTLKGGHFPFVGPIRQKLDAVLYSQARPFPLLTDIEQVVSAKYLLRALMGRLIRSHAILQERIN